ncbi:hypothetical protein ABFX02_04G221400 [Erythranthe guttata]
MTDQTTIRKHVVEDWKIGWDAKKGVGPGELLKGGEICELVKRFMDLERAERKEVTKRAKEFREKTVGAVSDGDTKASPLPIIRCFYLVRILSAEGASLPVAGLTAHMALTQFIGLDLTGKDPHHKNILVTAASGGVGQYAVQLAKLGGAHVTATCGARNLELVKSLGADEVLDYKTPEGAALKSPSGRKYDAVVHCAAGVAWSVFEGNLKEDGVVVDLTPGPAAMWTYAVKRITCSGKKLKPLMLIPKDDVGLKFLVELVKEGKLKTVIDSRHCLGDAEVAWSKGIAGHATGKIIVEP